jgi:R3H domain
VDLSAVIPGAQPIQESDSEDSDDHGQEDVNSFQEIIRNWMDETDKLLEFPATLSASERRIVHLEAENLGLQHRSRGTGADRRVLIQRQVA